VTRPTGEKDREYLATIRSTRLRKLVDDRSQAELARRAHRQGICPPTGEWVIRPMKAFVPMVLEMTAQQARSRIVGNEIISMLLVGVMLTVFCGIL
jgi:hypothetical protein